MQLGAAARAQAAAGRWAYPDTKKWDAERNVREFTAAMPMWKEHGLLGFTVNFQGGSPEGYSRHQPWESSAIRTVAVLILTAPLPGTG